MDGAIMRQFDWRRHGWRVSFFAIIILLQVLTLRRHYIEVIAPYPPRNHDQCTLIETAYDTYESLKERGTVSLSYPDRKKSLIFPWLCVLLEVLFGADRLTLEYANIAFLLLGETVLVSWLWARRGPLAATLGLGFFQLSGSHFFFAGGLDDLRFDFAGCVTYGLAFMAIVHALERPGRKALLSASALVLLSVLTRSTTGVYLAGLTGLLAGISGLAALRRRDRESCRNFANAAAIFGVTVLPMVAFLATQWRAFDAYYVGHLRSGEHEIRWQMDGGYTLWNRLTYYPFSFWDQFGVMTTAFAVVLAVGAIAAVATVSRRRTPDGSAAGPSVFPAVTAALAAPAAMFIILGSYSPSPVVICALGLALAWAGGDLGARVLLRQSGVVLQNVVAAAVLLFGCVWFNAHWIVCPYRVSIISMGKEVNRLFADVQRALGHDNAGETGLLQARQVAWMLVHNTAHEMNFRIYLHEHGLPRSLFDRHQTTKLEADADGNDKMLQELHQYDVVVVRAAAPAGGPAYPGELRQHERADLWRPILKDEFVLAGRYFPDVGDCIELYRRKVDFYVKHLDCPSGASARGSRMPPAFELPAGREMQITLENPTNEMIPVQMTLGWRPVPGINAPTLQWSLATDGDWISVKARTRSKELVNLQPGISTIRFRAQTSAATSGNTSTALLHHLQFARQPADVRLTARQP